MTDKPFNQTEKSAEILHSSDRPEPGHGKDIFEPHKDEFSAKPDTVLHDSFDDSVVDSVKLSQDNNDDLTNNQPPFRGGIRGH